MSSNVSPGRGKLPRNLHLQILRGLAASLVVVDHAIRDLQFNGEKVAAYVRPADAIGVLGVAAFFVLSGFLMARQSMDRFGEGRNALVFAVRRVLRVVPLYWLATAVEIHLQASAGPIVHFGPQLWRSLFFVPNGWSVPPLFPLLKQGWTLNYEMFFYAVFAACLCLRRRSGLSVLVIVLGVLGGVGPYLLPMLFPHPLPGRWAIGFAYYTNSIILLFLAGVVIGLVEGRIVRIVPRRLPISPALLLVLPPVLLLAFPAKGWSEGALRIYAIATVLLCTLGRRPAGDVVERLLVWLGDASYSTYLIHVWLFYHCFHGLLRLLPAGSKLSLYGPLFVAVSVVVANIAGVLVHRIVERPMTTALQRLGARLGGRWFARRVVQPNFGG